MATPVEEVKRLRAELAEARAERDQAQADLAELTQLVHAHLAAQPPDRSLEREREAFDRGREIGQAEGAEALAREEAAWRKETADRLTGPAHEELDRRRYGPGGREGAIRAYREARERSERGEPEPDDGQYHGGPVTVWEPPEKVRQIHPKAPRQPERELAG